MNNYICDLWNLISASVIIDGKMALTKDQCDVFPENSGLFFRSVGKPNGQTADWRSKGPREGGTLGIHVVEYDDRYEIHADRYDPAISPLKHLIFDFSPDLCKKMLTAGAAYITLRKLISPGRK